MYTCNNISLHRKLCFGNKKKKVQSLEAASIQWLCHATKCAKEQGQICRKCSSLNFDLPVSR